MLAKVHGPNLYHPLYAVLQEDFPQNVEEMLIFCFFMIGLDLNIFPQVFPYSY